MIDPKPPRDEWSDFMEDLTAFGQATYKIDTKKLRKAHAILFSEKEPSKLKENKRITREFLNKKNKKYQISYLTSTKHLT